jgi:hypothetical protein
MQFGKSLLGAILGAVVGTAFLFAIYRFSDGFWSAIPFAIIMGLGVRMVATTAGHASYARGALTMILALAAYIGGLSLVAKVANATANAPLKKSAAATAAMSGDKAGEDAKDGESKESAPAPEMQPQTTQGPSAGSRFAASQQFSPWNFIWLAVAALVAYEMGRGSDATVAHTTEPPQPALAGTHPDA